MPARTSELTAHDHVTGPRGERVLVRRSARRRRTVSIARSDGNLVVSIPASMSRREERRWVEQMVQQLRDKEQRNAPPRRSDADLLALAREVSDTYLGGRARPASVTWSTRQNRRWGSCTSADATIRLSHRLQGMPDYVVRAVMMHELVHLLVPDHGPEFRALMANYPDAERANAFLDGVTWATHQPGGPGPLSDADEA
ncbi:MULTISPECIES: M48 family metallopeptidase [unclassified Brachybacterium]|uniref:M48 metallopeptidase family protein n=1 Tax=unclassified Brachybacterium TaxID=2623841 RepID=UPI000C7FEEED|nr:MULTISPECIES: M48 family metallopeptidase [unclassified Brachybacterium]PMC75192.1 metal-dependent hydrolase [Brachybacterium sp. UMB0905]